MLNKYYIKQFYYKQKNETKIRLHFSNKLSKQISECAISFFNEDYQMCQK